MTPMETLKRLAELQKDATKGPWSYEPQAFFPDRVWMRSKLIADVNGGSAETEANAALIAQSGSTDFAALADYVEGLRAALTEIAYSDIFDLTMKEIAREALAATIAECGE